MVRAAAKNFRHVAVVVDPADYALLLEQLDREGGIDAATRLYFAQKAFRHTGRYEAAIAGYFSQVEEREGAYVPAEADETFPYRLSLTFEKVQDLRYGENPHQRAAFYSDLGSTLYSVAAARKMQGKELSFNNILDLDAAWRLVTEIDEPACVIVKHTNPCGTGARRGAARGLRARVGLRPDLGLRRDPGLQREASTPPPRARLTGQFVEAVIAPGLRGRGAQGPREEGEPARHEHGHDRHPQGGRLRPAPRDGRAARAAVGPPPPRARPLRGGDEARADARRSGRRCSSPGRW